MEFTNMKKTQKNVMTSKRQLMSVILVSFLSLFLVASCSVFSYLDPDVYPVEEDDILIPGPEVRIIGFTNDGDPIVSPEFIDWMERLKQEISRLRVLLLGEEKLDKVEEVIKD